MLVRNGKPTMWLAMHEAGHAVARFALNQAYGYGPMVKGFDLRSVKEGVDAIVYQDPRIFVSCPRGPDFPDKGRQFAVLDAIEALAGPAAELKQRERASVSGSAFYLRLVTKETPDKNPLEEGGDFNEVRYKLQYAASGREWETLFLDPATELACALVAKEWPAIRAIGLHMRDVVSGDSEEIYELWSKAPKSAAKCYLQKLKELLNTAAQDPEQASQAIRAAEYVVS